MIVGIIGGGAAGMAAALTACREGSRVILYERQARLGRKLMATGNGRCNLSNREADVSHYHGEAPDFVRPALSRFDVKDTLAFFGKLGLLTVEEPDGKIYPFSNQANSVTDVLRLALEHSACELRLGCEVKNVAKRRGSFLVEYEGGQDRVDRLIVAAGGLAGSQLGGTGAGYAILKSLGHSCTKLYPALVQLRTDRTWVRSLKGVRCDARVKLLQGERLLAREEGEVQFTDFGISGPCVFALARACAGKEGNMTAVLDLCPCLDKKEIQQRLRERRDDFASLTMENYLTGLLHNRLGRTVLRFCGFGLEDPVNALTDRQIGNITTAIKGFTIPVLGAMDLSQAQVTAGGIRTAEFDPATLESRIVPGLYAAGEVLDIDGDCGGFNLQWAWSSGRLAGLLLSRREGTI